MRSPQFEHGRRFPAGHQSVDGEPGDRLLAADRAAAARGQTALRAAVRDAAQLRRLLRPRHPLTFRRPDPSLPAPVVIVTNRPVGASKTNMSKPKAMYLHRSASGAKPRIARAYDRKFKVTDRYRAGLPDMMEAAHDAIQ